MSPATPTQLGKYRILDRLGEGAMGIVYRAEDTVLARQVAVKVMTEGIAWADDLRDRFVREARAAGSLQHSNVVTVYDFGEADGHLFIAMEYVEGVDLAELLTRPQPLALDATLAIVGDVLSGLAYAHKRGVVHRDIKPANVRVTDDGRGKIMDFGIAHIASSELTRTGYALGTPSYMAPEQVTGEPVTAATDLFAVGVMLHEMLSGEKPFAAPTVHSIMYKIVHEEPADLRVIAPHVPGSLADIVRRALQKDPANRYGSALEMATELAAVRGPASVSGPGEWTMAVLAGPPTGSASNQSARSASHATESLTGASTAERARPARRGLWVGGGVAACALVGLVFWARGGPAAATTPATTAAPPVASQLPAPIQHADAPPPTPSIETPAVATIQPSTQPSAPVARAAPTTADRRSTDPAKGQPTTPAVTAPPVVPSPSVAPPGAAPVAAPVAAPITAAPAAVDRAPAGAAPDAGATAATEIGEAARTYARALESRDIGAVRRAYPGISDADERGFRQFFGATRSLHVTFAVHDIAVTGDVADARLTGAYDYTTSDGQRQHQPVEVAATFRHEGGVWRLMKAR